MTETASPSERVSQKRLDIGELYERFEGHPVSLPHILADSSFVDTIQNGESFTELEYSLARKDSFRERVNRAKEQSPEIAVAVLYAAVLDRDLDPEGRETYASQIREGRPVEDILKDMLRSDEYHNRAIAHLYQELLGRDPDPEGQNTYLDQFKEGKDVHDVAEFVRSSDEYRNRTSRLSFHNQPLGENITRGKFTREDHEKTAGANSELQKENEELTRQLESERRVSGELKRERDNLHVQILEARSDAPVRINKRVQHVEGALQASEKQVRDLTIENNNLKGSLQAARVQVDALRQVPTNKPFELFLRGLGLSRETFSRLPEDVQQKTIKQLLRLAHIMFHPDAGVLPSETELKNVSHALDQLDTVFQRNMEEQDRKNREETARARGGQGQDRWNTGR